MLDCYRVASDVRCSWCGGDVGLLQGKHGPCLLLLWEQGHVHPVEHLVDEDCRLDHDALGQLSHPAGSFEIYGDCKVGHPARYVAIFDDSGLWTSTDTSWEERFVEEKRARERRQ